MDMDATMGELGVKSVKLTRFARDSQNPWICEVELNEGVTGLGWGTSPDAALATATRHAKETLERIHRSGK